MTREELRRNIAARLVEIADIVGPDYRLTLVARNIDPAFAPPKNADIMVGDDEIDRVIAALERLEIEGS